MFTYDLAHDTQLGFSDLNCDLGMTLRQWLEDLWADRLVPQSLGRAKALRSG